MANIAEGFGRHRRAELIHFLHIASGSCAELRSHLYVAIDNHLIEEDAFAELQEQADKVGRKLTAFRQYLQRTKARAAVKEDQAIYTINDQTIKQ
jgi:four helix bundle protein